MRTHFAQVLRTGDSATLRFLFAKIQVGECYVDFRQGACQARQLLRSTSLLQDKLRSFVNIRSHLSVSFRVQTFQQQQRDSRLPIPDHAYAPAGAGKGLAKNKEHLRQRLWRGHFVIV